MIEVMWFTALIGLLCGLAGYFIGHDSGSAKWMTMYIDEQNKRIKAEHEIVHLRRTKSCLDDAVTRQQKLLELFNAEAA